MCNRWGAWYYSKLKFCCTMNVLFNNILQWPHNERDGVSNHQHLDCLLNGLFRRRSKKTSKLRVTDLCVGNSPVTGEFPAQRSSNAENVSIWWRHHERWAPHNSHSLETEIQRLFYSVWPPPFSSQYGRWNNKLRNIQNNVKETNWNETEKNSISKSWVPYAYINTNGFM